MAVDLLRVADSRRVVADLGHIPLLFVYLFDEGSPTEMLQWAMLAALTVLAWRTDVQASSDGLTTTAHTTIG